MLLDITPSFDNSSVDSAPNFHEEKSSSWAGGLYSISLGIILFVISVTTLAGNVITILAVKKVKSLRSKTNYLIVSLACADLMVGLFVAPIGGVLHILRGRWIFGYWFCHIWHAFDVLASTASILNLTAISLDRFVAIRRALDYPNIVTHTTCVLAISLVWLLSTLISVPAIAIWHFSLKNHSDNRCEFTDNRMYRILSSLISFYLPLCLMTFAYASVYLKAQQQLKVLTSGNLQVKRSASRSNSSRHRNSVQEEEEVPTLRVHRGGGAKWSAHENTLNPYPSGKLTPVVQKSLTSKNSNVNPRCQKGIRIKYNNENYVTTVPSDKSKNCRLGAFLRERKATKTLGIVFGVFILCWLPFFTLNVVQAFMNQSFRYELQLFDCFTLLGYANSCLNPFIYAATNTRFRSAFLEVVGRDSGESKQKMFKLSPH